MQFWTSNSLNHHNLYILCEFLFFTPDLSLHILSIIYLEKTNYIVKGLFFYHYFSYIRPCCLHDYTYCNSYWIQNNKESVPAKWNIKYVTWTTKHEKWLNLWWGGPRNLKNRGHGPGEVEFLGFGDCFDTTSCMQKTIIWQEDKNL